jgi:hypothetical protein
MKLRLLGAGVVLAASVLAPQQAHALVATTQYVPFKIFQNSANNIPLNLNFQSFSSLIAPSPNINLTGIGFKIAGAVDGTGTAMVGGNPRVSNQSETANTQPFIAYAPKFMFKSGQFGNPSAGPVTGSTQNANPNPVNCVGTQTCPAMGGNIVPSDSTRTLDLQGNYDGSGGFASINNTWSGFGVSSNDGTANFSGTGADLAFNFDPTLSPSVVAKPFIMGFIAVQYQYSDASPVPGPLPLFGAAAAFGWSRRLRKRVSSAV